MNNVLLEILASDSQRKVLQDSLSSVQFFGPYEARRLAGRVVRLFGEKFDGNRARIIGKLFV